MEANSIEIPYSPGAPAQNLDEIAPKGHVWFPSGFWMYKPSWLIFQRATFSNHCTSLWKLDLYLGESIRKNLKMRPLKIYWDFISAPNQLRMFMFVFLFFYFASQCELFYLYIFLQVYTVIFYQALPSIDWYLNIYNSYTIFFIVTILYLPPPPFFLVEGSAGDGWLVCEFKVIYREWWGVLVGWWGIQWRTTDWVWWG